MVLILNSAVTPVGVVEQITMLDCPQNEFQLDPMNWLIASPNYFLLSGHLMYSTVKVLWE